MPHTSAAGICNLLYWAFDRVLPGSSVKPDMSAWRRVAAWCVEICVLGLVLGCVTVETSITAHHVFVAPDVDVPNGKTGAEQGECI